LRGEVREDVLRLATPENEWRPEVFQGQRQLDKRLVEPPQRGLARRPWTGGIRIVNVNRQDGSAGGNGSLEGRMVGETQIVAEPDDYGFGGHGGYRFEMHAARGVEASKLHDGSTQRSSGRISRRTDWVDAS
jgi:hypothetical protein